MHVFGSTGNTLTRRMVITFAGLVNPILGTVDLDGSYTVGVSFTCYGDEGPRFEGVPVSLTPYTKDIMIERIAGYDDVIYLFRKTPYYEP